MKVYITPEIRQRLDLYVDATHQEISGLGRVLLHKGNMFIVNLYLLEQECTASDTELKPEAVAEFLTQLITNNEKPEEVKLWWHSHANMGVFWSGTDEGTAAKFGNGWMLSLVVNKKGESKCRLDIYDPIHVTVDNLELIVTHAPASKEMIAAIEAEVKNKVTSKSYTYVGGRNAGFNGQGAHQDLNYYGYGGGADDQDTISEAEEFHGRGRYDHLGRLGPAAGRTITGVPGVGSAKLTKAEKKKGKKRVRLEWIQNTMTGVWTREEIDLDKEEIISIEEDAAWKLKAGLE
jgi:hypothetical protein